MDPSHSGGWEFIFLIYPGTSRHTDILRVLPSCTQTHIDTSLHFPLDMFMYLWDNFGLISLQCFCSHYCINTVHSPGTLWWGLLIVGVTVFWADGIVSWGIPVVSLRLSFYTGQIQSTRYFLLGGGIRPGCLHYGSSLRKEGWWCSECVLNPFIFDRARTLILTCIWYLPLQALLLYFHWRWNFQCYAWVGRKLWGRDGSCPATWSTGGDLGILLLVKTDLHKSFCRLTFTSHFTEVPGAANLSLLGVPQGKLGFSWVFPLSLRIQLSWVC